MRVLHVIESLEDFGGTPRKLLELARHSGPDFRYAAACLVRPGSLAEDFARSGVEIHDLKGGPRHNLGQLSSLMRVMGSWRPDVVNTHFARGHVYGGAAAALLGLPRVASEHGLRRNLSAPVLILDNLLHPFSRARVCNSAATRRAVERTIFLCRGKLRVVYNGIPLDTPEPSEIQECRAMFRIPGKSFFLLWVGGFLDWRDPFTPLRALRIVLERGVDAVLLMAGDGPLRTDVTGEVERLGLGPRTLMPGYLQHRLVKSLMGSCDVYLNSATEEGFGIATAEAMLLAKPVVCARAGSLVELVEDRVSGVLVQPGDPESLADAIVNLFKDSGLRKRLGKAAEERIRSRFSIERYVRDMEALYREAVAP